MSHTASRKTVSRWLRLPPGKSLTAVLEGHRLDMKQLAHDLRNPINSILLMAQLLEETGGTQEAVRIAKRIQRQCVELSGMVDRAMEKVPD